MTVSDLYDTDIARWADEQAAQLRRRAGGKDTTIDWLNVAEEIEAMGRSERRELTNRLKVLLAHLLKWRFQPDRRGRSWLSTIAEQRDTVTDLLDDNPSLRPKLVSIMARAYRDARRMAERETDLSEDTFPVACPWSFDQAMDPDEPPKSE